MGRRGVVLCCAQLKCSACKPEKALIGIRSLWARQEEMML